MSMHALALGVGPGQSGFTDTSYGFDSKAVQDHYLRDSDFLKSLGYEDESCGECLKAFCADCVKGVVAWCRANAKNSCCTPAGTDKRENLLAPEKQHMRG